MSKAVRFEGTTVLFETDSQGKLKSIMLNNQAPAGSPQIGDIKITMNGVQVTPKAGTIVITQSNPTCYWYWDGTQWQYICV